ncbi:uncharacterized protein L201_006810 [Kwoniella dendrophila CBS 6074]|uniref:Zn(2)-C6 fungal-type domain-containing protein n=1 Tax=Kwoniella dendrophila CBS 6074 TaxID=1295534 RepID=A0AAX4K445_9TREE
MDPSSSTGGPQAKSDKIKRGYRACLHCRSRKAKCDLGDIDAPSEPPCSRCKRESRECVFAPSRRGGNNRKRGRKGSVEESDEELKKEDVNQYDHQTYPYPYPPTSQPNLPSSSRPSPRSTYPHSGPNTGSSGNNPSPMTSVSNHTPPVAKTSFPSMTASTSRQSFQHSSTPSPKRHRLHLNPPLHAADPSSIVVADMQNESDALQILALASGQTIEKETIVGGRGRRNQEVYMHEKSGQATTVGGLSNFKRFYERRQSEEPPILEDFPLIKLGILNCDQAVRLVDRYFRYYHHIIPMCPSAVLPKCKADLAVYAHKERYAIATFIIIASRLDDAPGSSDIHDKSWAVMRGWITDVQTLGAPPTIGLVESLLLLAEHMPRTPPLQTPLELNAAGAREEVHGDENRQAWQLIGLAVRSAYELGLDKIALRVLPDAGRTLEIERARVAWTYCYLSDRHVSIRLGKGFWARGAAVCFQGFSSSLQSGPAAGHGNFPFLREISDNEEHPQEDYASLIQAYLELTQLMSNAHDTLYPNSARTKSLVVHGEYFKYLDELSRSLDAYKVLWAKKQWNLFPLTDMMWTVFYYTQLYICAFSFQAHVERATMRAEEEHRKQQQVRRLNGEQSQVPLPKLSLFPRGAAQSPDARYIFHMCDAAREILNICVNKLAPGGALPFLPTRHLLWFTYAAIVLLKAMYSGAMLRGDHQGTHDLVEKLCRCLSQTSTDSEYPGVRYGRQLETLRDKLAGLSDAVNKGSPPISASIPLPPPPSVPPSMPHDWQGRDSHPQPGQQDRFVPNNQIPPMRQEQPQTATLNGQYNTPANWRPTEQFPTAQSAYHLYPDARAPVIPQPQPPAFVSSQNPQFTAPYFQQPMTDIGVPSSGPEVNYGANSAFGSTDNWFGFVGLGNNWQGNNMAPQTAEVAPKGGLDLGDFWMQVGPGEAQGGFPFR